MRKWMILDLLILLLILQCDTASVIYIEDISKVRPQIELLHILNNETGKEEDIIKVTLLDKNDNEVEIENGSIRVNGITMSPPTHILFGDNRPYYKLDVPVVRDSLYTFEFVVNDTSDSTEEIYYAFIITPDIDLHYLDVSSYIPHDGDLTIAWEDVDFRYPQMLELQYWNPEGFNEDYAYHLRIDNPYLGKYTVRKKYIRKTDVDPDKDRELRLRLIAYTEGALDQVFERGGEIVAKMIIYQDIEVY